MTNKAKLYLSSLLFILIFFILSFSSKAFADLGGSWTPTANMVFTHEESPSAVLLSTNKVFMMGSPNEIYDPELDKWDTINSPANYLYGITLTALDNEKVLVTGPRFDNNFTLLTSAQLYNPTDNLWQVTGNMVISDRRWHSVTKLLDGKVLVAGGWRGYWMPGNNYSLTASAEIYDPTTNIWTETGSMKNARNAHTATLLKNGKVLVIGGGYSEGGGPAPYIVPFVELYDSHYGSWSVISSMNAPRSGHTATLLPNGKVLVSGGEDTSSRILSGAELYDPDTDTWSQTGEMHIARALHKAILLPNGKVLVIGGIGGDKGILSYNTSEIYDPVTGKWTMISTFMNAPRYNSTATLLNNGKVLIAGGSNLFSGEWLKTTEIYDPAGVPAKFNLVVPLLKQTDYPWAPEEFDHANTNGGFGCGSTIYSCGCAMTSIAMILRYYGVKKLPDGTELYTGTFNTWLKNNNGYFRDEGVNPAVAVSVAKKAKDKNPGFNYDAIEYAGHSFASNDIEKYKKILTDDLKNGYPVELGVPGHYIVASGIDNDTFTINDPFYDRAKLTDYNNTFNFLGRFIPSNSDVSYIVLAADKDVNITLKDSENNILAKSYIQYHINNPEAEFQEITPSLSILMYPKPSTGDYKIEINAPISQNYQLDSYVIDTNGNNKMQTINGTVEQDITSTLSLKADKESADNLTINLDSEPPITTIQTSGITNKDGWYSSEVSFTLAAWDNNSGVLKTEYSLDNGATLQTYANPVLITTEGITELLYRSIDRAGNVEKMKKLEINIDKTPPNVTINATPNSVWPPNGKMVNIKINGSSSDKNLLTTTFKVIDEYGSTQPVITDFGQTIQLEAKRNGNDKNGREYTIQAIAEDLAGNKSEASTLVTVPHNQTKK